MSTIFGETLVIRQRDGDPIELVVWGDEFYVRYENKDGYSVCFDQASGIYCYARLEQGRFISTGAAATKSPPAGIRRHLQESSKVQQARFNTRFNHLRKQEPFYTANADIAFTLGANNGLLNGRRVSDGNVKGLTILVEFSDVSATVDSDDVTSLLNGSNYTANGNFSSVREYFRLVSNNRLNYTNHVVGPVMLPHTKEYYETTSLVPEAFALAMTTLDSIGVDLTEFDSRNEGIFDAINFMYAGETVYGVNGNNNNPSDLWPHNSVTNLQHGNMQTHFYMLSSMGRRSVDLNIGTFCHESGHLLCRFPDLYDYGKRDGDTKKSRGIGRYCLMGGGNHLNRGRTPSPVCAYLRDLVGWASNEILLDGPGQHIATHADYGVVMKYRSSYSNEYYIVENRSQLGLDEHLPSSGIAIYHCDINGSNEWQDGTETHHYQIALLQADGRSDLEANIGSDKTDLFKAINGVALSHETEPNSRQWDGSDSGLVVSDITAPGQAINFSVGNAVSPSTIVTGKVVAHQLIPDDNPAGIDSSIAIAERGNLTSITVHVDITHSYIGDLLVSLISPSGKNALLHNRSGHNANDLRITYNHANATELQNMVDEGIKGNWLLHIEDQEGQDVGRLNSWNIEIQYEPHDLMAEGEAKPNIDIPDNSSSGISSLISINESGSLTDINVSINILHTYTGDLHLELISPSGQSALLHNRTGQSSNNLILTYDRAMATSLDVLIGEPIKGNWTLRVRDLEGIDTGTLVQWSLLLRYSS